MEESVSYLGTSSFETLEGRPERLTQSIFREDLRGFAPLHHLSNHHGTTHLVWRFALPLHDRLATQLDYALRDTVKAQESVVYARRVSTLPIKTRKKLVMAQFRIDQTVSQKHLRIKCLLLKIVVLNATQRQGRQLGNVDLQDLDRHIIPEGEIAQERVKDTTCFLVGIIFAFRPKYCAYVANLPCGLGTSSN